MTMIHHDSRDYNVAASEAAKHARTKMEALWTPGMAKASAVIEKIMGEAPRDFVAPASKIEIVNDPNAYMGARLVLPGKGVGALGMENHSFGQLCQHIGLPQRFATELSKQSTPAVGDAPAHAWGKELITHNLRTLLAKSDSKYLVRAVGDNARGILSNSYRRLDSRSLIEAFGKSIASVGAIAVDGTASLTKVEIKAMLPMIFEPVPNEVMCFGLSWSNSDYGNGAHSLRLFCLRLWCTNKAITDEQLRQIHLGKKLEENVAFSDRTYRLDTEASASALSDIVKHALSPDALQAFQGKVRDANDVKIDRAAVPGMLSKLDLNKDEIEEITKAYTSSDVEMMPAGDTAWRLSNAISYFAGHRVEDAERRLELERAAGKVLSPEAKKAA